MNLYQESIKDIIQDIRNKKLTVKSAVKRLSGLSYLNLGFAKIDTHRSVRKGFPEVVYSEGKSLSHLEKITKELLLREDSVVLTRADNSVYQRLKVKYPQLNYNPSARIIYFQKKRPKFKSGVVAVVTAGTSDIPVAEEAVVILEIMGNKVRRIYDAGVAGIHRLFDKSRLLNSSRAIIVIAGMDGVLPSVVAGLVNKPIIAVPTSVGYGANFKGIAPLLTMLNCCAPGVVVVNINNGFGAAYFVNMLTG